NYTKRDSPMPVYVSVLRPDGGALNNAYFYPTGNYLVFGKMDNGKDYAVDGDIVGHEYTHSVVETLCKIGNNPSWSEARAMNEALADYFACTVAGDPVEGDYASGGPRDLTNRFRYPEEVPLAIPMRDGSSVYTFPEEHDTGRIWGGALWDLRRSLGAPTADRLIFSSLPLLPDAATFADGRAALISASRQLDAGGGTTIAAVMDNRGIPEQMPYTYADPLAFSSENSYYVVTGFINPEGGPIETFGVLPVFATGRKYALIGVVDAGGAKVAGVKLVFMGADGQVQEKISPDADLAAVKVTLRGGQQAPVTRFQFAFAPPQGSEGKYGVGIAVSFDGREYKLAKTVDGGIVRDSGPAPNPPTEVVSPVPAPPTPTPAPTPQPPAPTPVVAAVVQVEPTQAVVPVGGEQRFSAAVIDTAGQTIRNATVQWDLEDGQGAGRITSTGLFTALKAGDATVVAKVGTVSGKAKVTVTPATAPAGVAAWKQMPGSEGGIVLGLAGSSTQGLTVLYEAGLDGVRRSVNGQAFQKIAGGMDEGILPSSVDVNPIEPGLVYVGTLNIGLWRSEDGGGSWAFVSEELTDPREFFFYGGGHPVIVSVMTDAEDSVALGTMGQGTYVYLAGAGWLDISEGMGTAMVNSFVMNRDATAMFVGTDNGAYRIREGETAWNPVNNGLKSPRSESDRYAMLPFVNRLAVNPLNQKELLAATDADGVFYSPDEGESWIPINNGLPEMQVFAVVFDPQVRGRMFCGLAHEGVYVSTDGGRSWQAARAGLANGTISALLFDPANPNRLYAATLGDGVWYLDLTANIRSEPPRVVATVPANGDLRAPVAAGASVMFSVAMDPNTLNTSTFVVKDSSNKVVPGTVTYDAAHFTAKFTPSAPLAEGVSYTAVVTTGAKDAGGTPLQADYSWSFTTAKAQPPTPVVKGDVSGDGKVNIVDATLALRLAVGLQIATPAQLTAADFNGDGRVAVNEVMLILRTAVGLGTL
ncbi:MAG: Ig-like domain-containing protein, partial [Armatimonadota bacterium]